MERDVLDRVNRRLRGQHCVASRAQLRADGVSDTDIHRWVVRGLWLLEKEVVTLPGAPPSRLQDVMRACLTVPSGVASFRTAASLWKIDDAPIRNIELTAPRWHRRRRGGFRVHETLDLPDLDRVRTQGIPVTGVARTIIDVCRYWPYERCEETFDEAERRGLVTVKQVEWRFLELAKRGRPGIGHSRLLLTNRSGAVPDSKFGRRLHRLLESAGIPGGVIEYEVHRPDGKQAFIDVAFPHARLAIEADSLRYHGSRFVQSSNTRQNGIALLGWSVLRFTWRDLVERPEYVVATVRAALDAAAAA